MRWPTWAVGLVLLGGCSTPTPKSVAKSPPIAKLPLSDPVAKKLDSLPICAYVIDPESKQLVRCSLGGCKREVVVQQTPTWRAGRNLETSGPKGKRPVLICGNLGGRYYRAVVDRDGWLPTFSPPAPPIDDMCATGPGTIDAKLDLVPVDDAKKTLGQADFHFERYQLEPRHWHFAIQRISLWGRDFADEPTLVAMHSSGVALIISNGQALVMDKATGAVQNLGPAADAVLWPRDLAKPERFRPIMKVGLDPKTNRAIHEWPMKSPEDWRRPLVAEGK